MKVKKLASTDDAEKLVCTAARGDYYDGFVGDTEYDELMSDVSTSERHLSAVEDNEFYPEMDMDTKISQYALLEKSFRRGHFGIWEHPQITLAVKGVSRSCMAQITRHRHASFDVQSQRYVDFSEKEDSIKIPKSLTDLDHATRGEGNVEVDHREALKESFEDLSGKLMDEYEILVENGVPEEDARFILPIGTKVNFTISANSRMLLHIANLRERADSQWEIREMTNKILDDEFKQWMPMTYHLWREHGPTEISP